MTTVFSMHPTVPAENWDNDFEFQQTINAASTASHTRQPLSSLATRLSLDSSADDWDRDQQSTREATQGATAQNWTPTRQASTAENWDDDFEDNNNDSPARKTTTSKNVYAKNPLRPTLQDPLQDNEPENWDDDFDIAPNTPSKPSTSKHPLGRGLDDDDDEDDREFGFNDGEEEDRTVTARSKRSALSHLSHSPPPPVPPIPLALLSATSHYSSERPYPRSPTASVFSVPATAHSGRESFYHNNSTTHLHPTSSRTSIAFANLPPSPPIHKERERRRLRKKSRPPEAVYELAVRNSMAPQSSSDFSEGSDASHSVRPESPRTPVETPPPQSYSDPATPENHRNSISASVGSPTRTPLLSRIGSVKRWGVRRKRASATPSEVMLQDNERSREASELGDFAGNDAPSDPSSSASSTRPGWFFRSAGGSSYGSPPGRLAAKAEPFPSAVAADPEPSTSKLVKRKSFGFVPIRRNKGPVNGTSSSDLPADLQQQLGLDSDEESSGKRSSGRRKSVQPRMASYGGLGLGRMATPGRISSDDLTGQQADKSRGRSSSRSRTRGTPPVEEVKEGSRGFMGNVRRISLVGRHKRTKSAASLASYETHNSPDIPRLPVKLQPPSPPTGVPFSLDLTSPTATQRAGLQPNRSKSPISPHSASLGRAAQAPAVVTAASSVNTIVPRRNSLGDLKIPARISQAQVGLRRDLGMVREFAANVEQLKELQHSYNMIVMEIQSVLDNYARSHAQQTALRPASPSLLALATAKNRSRSDTGPPHVSPPPQQSYKQLASDFYTINSKYRIAWECAELLIELGGGSASVPTSAPSTSASAPAVTNLVNGNGADSKKVARERAITLAGDESRPSTPSLPAAQNYSPPLASPPNPAWRASTGRHDLNQRQLSLLRDMLNNSDASFVGDYPGLPIPEDATQSSLSVNRDWRWGDAMNSTITLPSEESASGQPPKKRRSSRLNMSGLRDLLRSLKKGTSPPPLPASTVSLSTDSSMDSNAGHRYRHPEVQTYGRRRAKTSSGPESMRERELNNPYHGSSLSNKQSPRRPSLASIFRLGSRSKVTPPLSMLGSSDGHASVVSVADKLNQTTTRSSGHQSSSNGEDEDWDRLDSAGDLDHVRTDGFATIRGNSPYLQDIALPSSRPVTPKRSASGSQTSLWVDTLPPGAAPPTRATRLSNVEEHTDDARTPKPVRRGSRHGRPGPSPSQQQTLTRTMQKTGSVRSMPPQTLSDIKLAMTPENIKPLLENAREVHARLSECIAAIQALLAGQPTI